ncbi:hypothetical protein GCM10010517_81680 [Streptosporangium fragile]|uniref:Uncharacterized protein n=1 Tax=Streptosporangium fragile TaxID=46186 RepID=A0ABN3WID0_9ACTN
MNDRLGHEGDRLVYKRDEDDLTVPSQRTRDTAPASGEPHHGATPADRTDAPYDGPGDGPGRGARDDVPAPGPVRTPQAPETGAGPRSDAPGGAPVTAGFPEATAGRPDDVAAPGGTAAGTGGTDADLPDATRTGSPAHTGTAAHGAPAHAGGTRGLLFEQDAAEVRRRWQEVQASFVDDPRDSVERADALLDEVVRAFRSALEARTAELRGRWKDSGDTEHLRTALRDYRATLEQLLDISAGMR